MSETFSNCVCGWLDSALNPIPLRTALYKSFAREATSVPIPNANFFLSPSNAYCLNLEADIPSVESGLSGSLSPADKTFIVPSNS